MQKKNVDNENSQLNSGIAYLLFSIITSKATTTKKRRMGKTIIQGFKKYIFISIFPCE